MTHAAPNLELQLLGERFAVCWLDARDRIPAWATASEVLSAITRTREELSIITEEAHVPVEIRAERGWRAFRVGGTLPFDLVGIFAAMAQPLAEAGISIFALSTFDTDYLLVKEEQLAAAQAALEGAGHRVTG